MLPNRRRLPTLQALAVALPVLGFYLVGCGFALLCLPDRAWELKGKYLITLGLLNSWRYLWGFTIAARSWVYERFAFPELRRRAEALPRSEKFPAHLYLVIATYREQPWISRRMLRSVLRAAARLPCRTTVYISTGSDLEDAVFAEALRNHPLGRQFEVILMRQSGKRTAMAYALRSISRRAFGEHSLTVLMDGDTALGADVFEKCLPLFRLRPRVGAVTTNNLALTDGAPWYRDWYNLRFSMRHRQMNAVSLSGRVLALTGRFSVFRTELATSEEFIHRLENDGIDHWLFGRIKFKTGDDKSTWYTLLRHGWEMLYVPDAMVYCMESSGEQPMRQSFSKMARWFGNMLRNSLRAIWLGPRPTGLYTWWSLVDQRISIWTTLVGPASALLLGIFKSPWYLVFYLVVATATRCVYLAFLAFEGHRVVLRDIPLLFFTQWVGSAVKINVLANLARQSWGARTGGESAARGEPQMIRFLERFQPFAWSVLFLLFVGLLLQF
jgi:glycosyltransferase Alg8